MGVWGTIAGVAGTVGGSMIGAPWLGAVAAAAVNGIESANASKTAGQQQISAGNQALNVAGGAFGQQQALLAPWRQAGQTGLNAELGFLGLPQTSGVSMPAASGSTLGTAGPTPAYTLTRDDGQTGSISDPNANGGYAGQSPGTATLGSVSSYKAPGPYGPTSNPTPMLRVKLADGTLTTAHANEVPKGASVIGAL